MAEEIKSFLISFGTYLFFTFAWWALKAGFYAGELLVLVYFLSLFSLKLVIVNVVSVPLFQCTADCAAGSPLPLRRTVMPLNGPVSWAVFLRPFV